MSNLPPPPFGSDGNDSGQQPPGFGPPSFGPPPQPGVPQQPQFPQAGAPQPGFQQPAFQALGQPSSGSGGKKKAALVAGIVVVAGLAAGGVYIATKDDGDGSASDTTETEETEEDTEPDDTFATVPDITLNITIPDITVPDITVPEITIPDITLPDITVPPTDATDTTTAVPEGSVDLGHGVFVPLPAGWSLDSDEGGVVTISSETSSIALQVLERIPGEDPVAAMQEYVDTFDTDFPAVTYSTGELIDTLQGSRPVNLYRLFYRTFDPNDEDGEGIAGGVYLYIRTDGLTMVYDVYGSEDEVPGLEGKELTDLETSFLESPEVADPVDLVDIDPFQVSSATPFVEVEGFAGFYVAPGFDIVASGSGNGLVANDSMTIQVLKLTGQPDIDTAVSSAQTHLSNNYSNMVFGTPSVYDPDDYGVVHRGLSWNGNYTADGREADGAFDLFYDPVTFNAYLVSRAWFTDTANPNNEPFEREADFMFASFIESFTNIP